MTNGEMLFLAVLLTAFSVFGISLMIQSIRDQ
jgi:hypothetical protein